MKENNPLESQLRSWVPRRPSPKLEGSLFGSRRNEQASARDSAVWGAFGAGSIGRWLGPATAALLVLGALFNQRGGQGLSSSAAAGPMVAMILSNHHAAAYLPGSFTGGANNVPVESFEWTNGNSSTSSIRSISPATGAKRP